MKYELWDIQQEVVDKCEEYLSGNNNYPTIVVAPVASGKSLMIGSMVSNRKGYTLVLQPSKELLKQNYSKLLAFGGEASIYSASIRKDKLSKTIYATLGSVNKVVDQLIELGVDTVIIDECHYKFSPEYGSQFMNFMGKLQPKKVIGFTATPIRLHTISTMTGKYSQLETLHTYDPSYFKSILHVIDIPIMVEKELWTKLKYKIGAFDSSKLKLVLSGREFTDKSVYKAIVSQGIDQDIIKCVREDLAAGYKNILVFCTTVEEAEGYAKLFPHGEVVHGKTSKKERESIIDSFEFGDTNVVFNVGVLTTGFNHEEIDVVILGRPTNSLALFYQMCGRGTRRHKNKDHCVIRDLAGNISRFGKLEDLRFINAEGFGWGFFTQTPKGLKLLTNIPMGSEIYIDDLIMDKEEILAKIETYPFPFGKHEGKLLKDIPAAYRAWVMTIIGNSNSVPIEDKLFINQACMLLQDKESEIVRNDKEKNLVVVDFNNIAFILFKAKQLNPTGVKRYLKELAQKFKTTHVDLMTDSARKSYWRREVFAGYKQNRESKPPQPGFIEGLRSIYNSEIEMEQRIGYEADDLIAERVRNNTEYEKIVIVSADGDYKQLNFFNVTHRYNPMKRITIKSSKKAAIYKLVEIILKGDRKDGVDKCHLEKRIMTKDLEIVVDRIFGDLKESVKSGIRKASELPLESIILARLKEKRMKKDEWVTWVIDEEKYHRNYQLLCLIQETYPK